jgi:hypothetical protein
MKNIFYLIICILVSGLISGCMPPSVFLEPSTLIESEHFSVNSPGGETWVCKTSSFPEKIFFINEGYARLGVSDVYLEADNASFIMIGRVTLPDGIRDLNRDSVFRNYYSQIQKQNEEQYKTTGTFKTEVQNTDTFSYNGKSYFRVDYNLSDCLLPDKSIRKGAGILLFHFPDNYRRDRSFYIFQREEYFRNIYSLQDKTSYMETNTFKNLSTDFNSIINSFRIRD